MKSNILVVVAFMCACFMWTGCQTTDMQKTLNKMSGRATFDPSSYGTDALLKVLEDEKHSKANAVAAATELSSRTITEAHCNRLVATLKTGMSEKVEIVVLKSIKEQDISNSVKSLLVFFQKANGPDSAAEAAVVIMGFLPSDNHRFGFMAKYGIASAHPNVRARAARYLLTFEEKSVKFWAKALETETSASAALVMCEGLHEFGGRGAFSALEAIQNDVERKFKTDAYIGDENVTGDMVRAEAVNAVEDLRAGR